MTFPFLFLIIKITRSRTTKSKIMKKDTLGEVYGVTVQKGGVGKSTFSQALAYSFANQGFKTVLLTSSYKIIVEKKTSIKLMVKVF